MIPVFYPRQNLRHDPSQVIYNGMPFLTDEVPARAEILHQAALSNGLCQDAPVQDFGLTPIQAVHAPDLLVYLQRVWAQAAARLLPGTDQSAFGLLPETFAGRGFRRQSQHLEGRKGYYCFGTGTPILEHSWEAAYWSAQAAVSGAARLQAGERLVYALCRPPGHHAAVDLYGGYCYLNNAAIAARWLANAEEESGRRIAILDIDYHHGNGTQEIFYHDPQVFYISLHADPDQEYPYFWGGADELGEGPGEGFNRNFPLPRGTTDEEYLRALDQALSLIAGFRPQALVLSAGLDIGIDDPSGGFLVTSEGFTRIGKEIASLGLPTLVVQEGGYRLESLGENLVSLLSNL